MLSSLPNLHVAALINSYWYYVAMFPKAATELERTNLANLIEKVRTRIEQEMGQK